LIKSRRKKLEFDKIVGQKNIITKEVTIIILRLIF